MRKTEDEIINIPTESEWEDMNMFSKKDLEWEYDIPSKSDETSSGMFDH